jgi:signal transduction histidine kinase
MPRFSFSGLRARLILLVLLAIIPAILLILYTTAEQRQLATVDVRENAQWLTRLVAGDQERLIDETRQLLLTLTHLSEARGTALSTCSALFAELLDQYPQYTNLGVASPNGEVMCSALPTLSQVNISNQSYFQNTIEKRDFAVGGYQLDEITGTPTIGFGYPIYNNDGEVQSVVFAKLNLDWLNQLMTGSQLPEGSALIMIDRQATVLVNFPNPNQWVGKSIASTPLAKAIMSKGTGMDTLTGMDGVSRLYAFEPLQGIADSGFYVAVGMSEDVAFAQANKLLATHILGLSAVFALALAAAWFGGDWFILKRLRSLLDATRRVASGDLRTRTGEPYGSGELSQLALAFDQMTQALEQREAEQKRFEGEIIRQNRDLAALNTITATVSSSLDLPEILVSLKTLLIEQLNIPSGIIYFYDEKEDTLRVEAAWGVPKTIRSEEDCFPANELHYERVVRHKEVVLQSEVRQLKPFSDAGLPLIRPDWQSYLCVPLLAKGEVQGVLDLFSQAPVVFTQEQGTLFTSLGQQVGVAIQNARLFEQIWAGRQRLQILSQELLEVQESERRHIARELHDEIGQALTAVKVNLQAAQRLKDSKELSPYLDESIGIVERTLQQVRNLSLDLRPSMLDDLGMVAALRWYIDRQAKRAGFKAHFIAELPEMRLPPELETTCFRVVQEALTNVVRHAQAKQVEVELRKLDHELELVICDDGIGFDVNSVLDRASGDLSLGLLGMQERVQLVGGIIKISSDLKRGTEIQVQFPLPESEGSIGTNSIER